MLKHCHDAKEIEEFMVEMTNDYAARINENFTGIYGWIDETYVDGMEKDIRKG